MYFHQSFFRAVLATLLFAASFALTGCGNDGSTVHEVSGGYSIDSGLAQKGPLIRGSSITINSLSTSSLKPSGASYNFETINNLGAFDPSGTIFTSKLIETTASGYYFNESTAKVSKDIVMLRGISDLITDRAVNVNVLTQIANRRTRQLFTTKAETTFAAARTRAQRELLSAFYIYNSADLMPSTGEVRSFSELDLSKARAADQILAAISAQITQVGQDGSGISVLLADLEADLADDGLLNNSGGLVVSPISQLWAVWGTVNWAQIALNLNGFYNNSAYKGVDLSQWVDSSGGVDQVIDKFKFTASGTVGTPSQSPAYVAGPDDAGQCLSVNAGKLYRNGAAVAQSSVTAVRGDSFKIELTASTPGATSGYIQRSAPTASGACPASPPTTGTVRLSKYTVSFLQVCPSNTASNCSAPIVFDKQHQYYGGNDTGLPIGNAARTVDLLIQTTATKYIVSDPYVGNGSIFSYGLCCEFNLLNPPLASATKLFDLQMTTSGQAFFTNEGTNIAAKKSLNDGAWHRITVTFDGAVVKLYYDGQLDATSDSSYSKTNTVGTTLRIGEDYRGLQWLGRFYRAAVWDRALTDSQVANIPYQVPLPTANLVSYYTVENPANPTLGLRNMVNNNITLIYATR